MPSLTTTRNYADSTTLTQAQLDAAFNSIETWANTTKLDSSNLQTGAVTNTNLAANAVSQSNIAASSVGVTQCASDLLLKLVPSGAVVAFGGSSAPSGWLLCEGSAVSRSTYSALFNAIGTAHGSGDGSTTFNLPDYCGRFLRGADNGRGRDPDRAARTAMASGGNTGDNVGSTQGDQAGPHGHTVTDPAHNHQVAAGANAGGSVLAINNSLNSIASASLTTAVNAAAVTGVTVDSLGTTESRPTNAYVQYIIKT